MDHLGDYRDLHPLAGQHRSLLMRGRSRADDRPVVIKRAAGPAGPRLQREGSLLTRAQVPGVVEVVEWRPDANLLVLEDLGERNLAMRLGEGPLPLGETLRLMQRLSGAVAGLHQAEILHLDLHPENVLLRPADGTPVLLDLGSGARFGETPQPRRDGPQWHLAPEQRPGSGRDVSPKTDLHGLGVLMWSCLVGVGPPVDGLEAPSLRQLAPHLPDEVHSLLESLLHPAPEGRPASANEVALRISKLRAPGLPVELASMHQTHAREALGRALAAADIGDMSVVLLEGDPGAGKYRLVRQLTRMPAARRGIVALGRATALGDGGPYGPWLQALRAGIRSLQERSAGLGEGTMDSLLDALGDEARLLRGLVPELHELLGVQPDAAPIQPLAESDLERLVRRLLDSLGSPGAPLVLILEEAQWLDPASLRLLESLASPPRHQGLLLLLSFQPALVGEGHTLTHALEALRVRRPVTVRLKPMTEAQLLELCREHLDLPPGQARALSSVLLTASGGLPGKALRALRLLHNSGTLRQDLWQGTWIWDMERLASIQDKLLPGRLGLLELEDLPPGTATLLGQASCMGAEGSLRELALVVGRPLPELDVLLEAARDARLIHTSGERWRMVDQELQQVARDHLTPTLRRATHGRIARMHLDSGESERFFVGVDHLNLSAGPGESPQEREERARLNIEAARRSRQGAAFDASLAYTTAALEIAPETWSARERLTLYREAAMTAHLAGDQTRARRMLLHAGGHANTVLERATLAEIQMSCLLANGELEAARDCGLAALAEFGLVPDDQRPPPPPPQLSRLITQAPDLSQLGKTRNQLLARMVQMSWYLDSSLVRWAAGTLCHLAIQEGPTVQTGVGMVALALEHSLTHAPALALRLGEDARSLAFATGPDDPWAPIIQGVLSARLEAQVLPAPKVLARLEGAISWLERMGRQHDALVFAVPRALLALRSSQPLDKVEARCTRDLELARRLRHHGVADRLLLTRQLCRALAGDTRPGKLDDADFEEATLLGQEQTDAETRAMVEAAGLWLAVLADDPLSARIRADSVSAAWRLMGPSAATPLLRTLRGIARLMGRPTDEGFALAEADREWLQEAGWDQAATLLTAELHRARERQLPALGAFDQAMQSGEDMGPVWVTLVASRAASFHGASGREQIASSYRRTLQRTRLEWRRVSSPGPRRAEAPQATSDPRGGLAILMQAITVASLAHGAALVLVRPEGLVLQLRYGSAGAQSLQEPVSEASPVSLKALGRVRETKRPFQSGDCTSDARLSGDAWTARAGLRSLLVWPLLSEGRLVGMIVLESKVPASFVTPPPLLHLLRKQLVHSLLQQEELAELRLRVASQQSRSLEQQSTELRFQDVFTGAPDPMLLCEDSGRVVLANAAAERVLERRQANQTLDRLLGAPELVKEAQETLLGTGAVHDLELELASHGAWLASATRLHLGGQAPLNLWVLRSVESMVEATRALERRIQERTEQLTRSNAELESSNAELRQFATLASHDLKSPIRTVSSYLSLLQRRHSEQLDEKGRSYLERSVAGTLRMQTLIDDLLSFSQVGQDRRPFVHVDLNEVLATALENLQGEIVATEARVELPHLPAVSGNPSRLGQLFQNLLGNALKYRREGVPPHVRVQASVRGGLLHMRISDNGIGIPPASQHVVFNIFKRLHGRGTYKGNGIGLAICRKIVELHGGRIWVESHHGAGTTFALTLPALEDSP